VRLLNLKAETETVYTRLRSALNTCEVMGTWAREKTSGSDMMRWFYVLSRMDCRGRAVNYCAMIMIAGIIAGNLKPTVT
jgi:hypothetical protein